MLDMTITCAPSPQLPGVAEMGTCHKDTATVCGCNVTLALLPFAVCRTGESEKSLRAIFDAARSIQPCAVFIVSTDPEATCKCMPGLHMEEGKAVNRFQLALFYQLARPSSVTMCVRPHGANVLPSCLCRQDRSEARTKVWHASAHIVLHACMHTHIIF